MNFTKHSEFKGLHAFLSASQYHWINYDEEKLEETYLNLLAKQKGTRLHELASELISLGIRLPEEDKTLNMYVNDAIGYGMTPEQPLVYSENCFGTADTIAFFERKKFLRIHDLKTGKTPASMNQLRIYASLFCLEYDVDPNDIDMELRIYQNNQIIVDEVEEKEPILYICRKIVDFDKRIDQLKEETYG